MENRGLRRWASWGVIAGVAVVVGCSGEDPPAPPEAARPAVERETQDNADRLVFERLSAAAPTSLNAVGEVAYVGSDTCRRCHPNRAATYDRNRHSQSLRPADAWPHEGAVIAHPASHREYVVEVSANGTQTHVEKLRSDTGRTLPVAEYAIDYVMGSGHFGHSFLSRAGDFLVQSPVSWYSQTQSWGMSPGYDAADQPGFGRLVTAGCIRCHAGLFEPIERNRFQLQISEPAIGCERCHGPGELHVARWESPNLDEEAADRGGPDATIVNPGGLSRELADAICSDCHLQGDVRVELIGRSETDFRPGRRLEDVFVAYRVGQPSQAMEVVGHVDQLNRSPCYVESETLSCITCHDPHHEEPERTAVFQGSFEACLRCHAEQDCEQVRAGAWDGSAEACVGCHMPSATTSVPHVSFTHHRIGVHRDTHAGSRAAKPEPSAGPFQLMPMTRVDHLPEFERRRAEFIAYWWLLHEHPPRSLAGWPLDPAPLLALADRQPEALDPHLKAALAEVCVWAGEQGRALRLADELLASEGIVARPRVTALEILLQDAQSRSDAPEAIRLLSELTQIRRQADDEFLLAQAHARLGTRDHLEAAVKALEASARIAPAHPDTHRILSQLYEHLGQEEQGRKHQRLLELLQPPVSARAPSAIDQEM